MSVGMKSLSLWPLLPSAQPVCFLTPLPVAEAVRYLATNVQTSPWGQPLRQHLYGHASAESVYLERVTPFFHNSWRPVFEGRLEARAVGSALVGSFGMSKSTRRFMTFFIGFGLAWSAFASCSVALSPQPDLPFWFPFVGIGMAGVGVIMARVASRISSGDIEWLSEHVRDILAATLSSTGRGTHAVR